MRNHAFAFGIAAAALLSLGACDNKDGGNGSGQAEQAQGGDEGKTIAAGLPADGRYMAAAKTAGLDQTLAQAGPYTVFVPTDDAIGKAPQGSFDASPANRAQLTGIITNMILPGTVLVADIDRAIEAKKGPTPLATMGGGTVTASKEDGKTVLTDSAGNKAVIVQGDQQFSNGVVHRVDGMLMPSRQAAAAGAQPAG